MNNKLIDEINFKFCEIEEDLRKIHELSKIKKISSIIEIQETKESILTKQKAVIDLINLDTMEIHVVDRFVTRLENTAKSVQLIK